MLNMITVQEFPYVEINNVASLRTGHMLAQQKFVSAQDYVPNGLIFALADNGELKLAAKEDTIFLHYTEELNSFSSELKHFAVLPDTKKTGANEFYPRCLAISVGDTFHVSAKGVDATVAAGKFAKIVNGQLTLTATAAAGEHVFAVTKSTMPLGDVGYEFVYVRKAPEALAK